MLVSAVSEPDRSVSQPLTFRALVQTHQQTVYYLALDLTGNHHDAEDLSQEVFIKAHRAMDRFRGDASYKTWLYRIAVNTYLNKKRKKALAFMKLWGDVGEPELSHPSHRPDEHAEASTIQRHIDQALEKLSPRERSAFVLRFYQDLPVREVAETLEVAEGTVKSLLYRATQKLQKELAFYRQELGLS